MSLDLAELGAKVRNHGRVVRVVVAETRGSVPRERGAAMLVWDGGQCGTIGGGALELAAVRKARRALNKGDWMETIPLGPGLGQCCGGSVNLLAEVFDKERLSDIAPPVYLRRVQGNGDVPLALKKMLSVQRSVREPVTPTLSQGWMIEPVSAMTRRIWVFGAGHVGRAVVNVLAALPEMEITWVDSEQARFPDRVPESVVQLVSRNPADAVRHAPNLAEHLIFTYSHAIDLEICHRLLGQGFRRAGLIGSKTKWARFHKRLAELGHADGQISRINCPIGRPELGKHPQAIAIGVAAEMLEAEALLDNADELGGMNG